MSTSDGLILMYHRIAAPSSDPWGLSVTAEHFVDHLRHLSARYHPTTLEDLAQRTTSGRPLDRRVAVTFDDGYADNCHVARPLLKQYNVPATVFMCSDGLEQRSEYWWDELDRLLLQPGELPRVLEGRIAGRDFEFDLQDDAVYSNAEAIERRGWRALGAGPAGRRQELYLTLYGIMRLRTHLERADDLRQLREWSGVPSGHRDSHRPMARKELAAIEADGLIAIGAHSVTHPFLSELPEKEQRAEIEQSKHAIETVLGHPIDSFAYPNGSYDSGTVRLLCEADFSLACCSKEQTVTHEMDVMQLPRVVVEDLDLDQFGRLLARWL